MSSLLGIDLGGTKIAAARYDAQTWDMQEEERTPTRSGKSFDTVAEDIIALAQKLRSDDTTALGIGVPGLVRHPEGVLVTLPNIPHAEEYPLKQKLTEALALPVAVGNDANCFTLAEAHCGAGKGKDVVVGITMGTGVGGGIVVDGKIYRGSHGCAAEIGHMLLQPGQPPFKTTDKRGDIEQFLSGTAMGKRCEEAQRPEDYLKGEVCAFLRPEIFREVAWMCVNLIHLLDPAVIIFGGSAGRALEPHLDAIKEELKQWMLPRTPAPELTIAILPNAATLGAALLTQQ
ncbi:MAG: ROK family protein [Candidatus Peribacteraceae bacterium]|jgi:glucokinase